MEIYEDMGMRDISSVPPTEVVRRTSVRRHHGCHESRRRVTPVGETIIRQYAF